MLRLVRGIVACHLRHVHLCCPSRSWDAVQGVVPENLQAVNTKPGIWPSAFSIISPSRGSPESSPWLHHLLLVPGVPGRRSNEGTLPSIDGHWLGYNASAATAAVGAMSPVGYRGQAERRPGVKTGPGLSIYFHRSSVVSHKRLNNRVTRVIPAHAGIQKRYTVDPVSSTEQHTV
jgi:hypothetical protein